MSPLQFYNSDVDLLVAKFGSDGAAATEAMTFFIGTFKRIWHSGVESETCEVD